MYIAAAQEDNTICHNKVPATNSDIHLYNT